MLFQHSSCFSVGLKSLILSLCLLVFSTNHAKADNQQQIFLSSETLQKLGLTPIEKPSTSNSHKSDNELLQQYAGLNALQKPNNVKTKQKQESVKKSFKKHEPSVEDLLNQYANFEARKQVSKKQKTRATRTNKTPQLVGKALINKLKQDLYTTIQLLDSEKSSL